MIAHRTFILFLFLLPLGLFAQRGIWGVANIGNPLPGQSQYGFIYRTDAHGDSLVVVHEFDQVNGRVPYDLILASNGKLYGGTQSGGANNAGVLFEFDLEHDAFRVVHHFMPGSTATPYALPSAQAGLLEVRPGVIYGQVTGTTSVPAPRGHVFAYDIATEIVTSVVGIPGFNGGTWNDQQNNHLRGRFFKAPNGSLYAAGARNSTCPVGQPDNGTLFRINPNTGALATVYINPCSSANGTKYNSPSMEANGLLYGTAGGGLGAVFPSNMDGFGVIYSFDTQSNTYTRVHAFTGGAVGGEDPHPELLPAANGKWYGTTMRGGSANTGAVYEFDPATQELAVKQSFLNTQMADQLGPYGHLSLAASNGKLYGANTYGILEYDPMTDVLRKAARFSRFSPGRMIEICRKPSYQPAPNTVFALCSGTPFAFHSGADHADSLVWRQNGEVVSDQVSAVLNLDSTTVSNTGQWQLELINACGSTLVPAITITVEPATGDAITSVLSPAGAHGICPGDSIELSGNVGGTWSNGATSPSIWVAVPGSYQVSNTNACGTTFSNVITVDTLFKPKPEIYGAQQFYCPGDSMVIHANMEGLWNNGMWGASITVPAEPNVQYALFSEWECTTDISNWFWLQSGMLAHEEPLPEITYDGGLTLCPHDSLMFHSNDPQIFNSTYLWSWRRVQPNGSLQYMGQGLSYLVTAPGNYVLQQRTPCGEYRYSDTLTVVQGYGPPDVPTIVSSLPANHMCPGDTIVLSTDATDPVWSTGAVGPEIVVLEAGAYWVVDANGCGETASPPIEVQVSTDAGTVPVVWLAEPEAVCENADPLALGGAVPPGGAYSGAGVSQGLFQPEVAGAGTHSLHYSYTNAYGCSGTAEALITVSPMPGTPTEVFMMVEGEWGQGTEHAFCGTVDGQAFAYPILPGEWSDGETAELRGISEIGAYRYRYVNACGTGPWSVEVNVILHPAEYTVQVVSICTGDSLAVGGSFYSEPGVYTDSLSNVFGCDSVVVTLLSHQAVALDTGVEVADGSITANEPDASYQWLDCGAGLAPIPGATDRVFEPGMGGSYAVVIRSSTCTAVADTSACVELLGPTGVGGLPHGTHLRMHPNPTTGKVRITSAGDIQRIEVRDARGSLLATRPARGRDVAVDLAGRPGGVYFLHVIHATEVRVERVVLLE